MRRYAIVNHHEDDAILSLVDNKIIGQNPVHDHIAGYHWFRLDKEHTMMLADYSVSKHATLTTHEKVSLLPHIGSTRTIHQHLHKHAHEHNKDKHWNTLQTVFGLDETHSMEDLIELVVAKQGAIYSPTV